MAKVIYANSGGVNTPGHPQYDYLFPLLKGRLKTEGIDLDLADFDEVSYLSGHFWNLQKEKETKGRSFTHFEEIMGDKFFQSLGSYRVLIAHLGLGFPSNLDLVKANFPRLNVALFSLDPNDHWARCGYGGRIFNYKSCLDDPSKLVEFIRESLEEKAIEISGKVA